MNDFRADLRNAIGKVLAEHDMDLGEFKMRWLTTGKFQILVSALGNAEPETNRSTAVL